MRAKGLSKGAQATEDRQGCTYEDARGLQRSGTIIGDAGSSAMVLVRDNESGKTIEVPHYKVRVLG